MTPDESARAVGTSRLFVAYSAANREVVTVGTAIGYSVVPELVLAAADGSRTFWRHDLVRPATVGEEISAQGIDTPTHKVNRTRTRLLELANALDFGEIAPSEVSERIRTILGGTR